MNKTYIYINHQGVCMYCCNLQQRKRECDETIRVKFCKSATKLFNCSNIVLTSATVPRREKNNHDSAILSFCVPGSYLISPVVRFLGLPNFTWLYGRVIYIEL